MPSNDVARWRQSSKFGHAMPEPWCSARKTRRSGVGIRQRPHQHRIRHREHRRRRADAEDEHGQRRDREAGRAPQQPRPVSQVAPDRVEPGRADLTGGFDRLRQPSEIAERPAGGPLRAGRRAGRCASISRSRWSWSSSRISASMRRRPSSPRSQPGGHEAGNHPRSPRTRRIDSANSCQVSVSLLRRFRPARVMV